MALTREQVIISVVVVIALFFILSALIMALWNSSVKKAFRDGAVKKINYSVAMGLTFFIMILPTSGYYIQSV